MCHPTPMIKNKDVLPLAAYTLIEILVVATIIIVLTAISVASFSTANKSAKDAKRKSDLETIKQAMVLYKAQNGGYATSTALLTDGTPSYLSPPFPVDPAGSSYQVGALTATEFCFCADVESNKGNHATQDCSGSWVSGTGDFYCVRQP